MRLLPQTAKSLLIKGVGLWEPGVTGCPISFRLRQPG